MKSCAIIVLNYKQPVLTQETIDNLLQISHSNFNYHIYLVDSDPDIKSSELLSDLYLTHPQITLITTKYNTGFAAGNNIGIKQALSSHPYDYILLANNDIFVDSHFLEKLIDFSEKNKDTAIVGPKIYFYPGFEYHLDSYPTDQLGNVIWSAGGKIDWQNVECTNIGIDETDHDQYNQTSQVDYVSGCVCLFKTKYLQKIGLLDEKYFMYIEDADICQRALHLGYKVYYLPQSLVWHLNSGSSKPGSDIHNYFLTRNRLLFALKYACFRTKLAVIKQSLMIFLRDPSVWRKKAVRDFFLLKFGRGSWR